MIFNTITDDITGATKSISIFNSTLSTIKKNIKNGQGITYSIFSGNKLNQKDIQAIINYANALKDGANLGKAWKDNISNCSVAAKQYVLDAKKEIIGSVSVGQLKIFMDSLLIPEMVVLGQKT